MNEEEHDHEHVEGISLENLKANYPQLFDDLMQKKTSVDEIQKSTNDDDLFQNYNPSYKDFLARATTEEECLDIIEYLESQNEIDGELAKQLRDQLEKDGPESFGTRKGSYYSTFLRR